MDNGGFQADHPSHLGIIRYAKLFSQTRVRGRKEGSAKEKNREVGMKKNREGTVLLKVGHPKMEKVRRITKIRRKRCRGGGAFCPGGTP